MFGYAGQILSIDLTDGRIDKTPLSPELARKYIGGLGINARLAYDLIRPCIDALSPDNVLIFGAGVLTGTMAPTSARTHVNAKSPLSGLIGSANAGDMGAMLKYAGYDHLVIKGRAKKPVFLLIKDDTVEVRDASYLWGKDVVETTDLLWQELGDRYCITTIGQAGENLVRFATIMCNKWATFGRNGLGAVMGSKNLKAIAIYGTKGIKVAHPGHFMQLVNDSIQAIQGDPDMYVWRGGGTWAWGLRGWEEGKARTQRFARTKRMDTELLDYNAYWEHYKVKAMACMACPIGCKGWLEIRKGKCQGFSVGVSCTHGTMHASYGLACGITTFDDVAKTTDMGQRYGLCSLETSGIIQFVMELYEKGVIKKDDCDGLELTWGNTAAIQQLMHQIVFREGFGAKLADGIVEASRRIGPSSEPYLYHVKGTIMPLQSNPDIRARVTPIAFGRILNPRGLHGDPFRYPVWSSEPPTPEVVMKYAQHMGIPEDMTQRILREKPYDLPLLTKYIAAFNLLVQLLGICDRDPVQAAVSADIRRDLYFAATGIDISTRELLQAGERVWNLERAFNVREGASRKDDTHPEMVFREPFETYLDIKPPFKREVQDKLLDRYYDVEGWDIKTGIPTARRLRELGLEDVARDMEGS